MSRRYCRVCGERHENGSQGTCDMCHEAEMIKQFDAETEFSGELNLFQNMNQDERWNSIFTWAYERGYRV